MGVTPPMNVRVEAITSSPCPVIFLPREMLDLLNPRPFNRGEAYFTGALCAVLVRSLPLSQLKSVSGMNSKGRIYCVCKGYLGNDLLRPDPVRGKGVLAFSHVKRFNKPQVCNGAVRRTSLARVFG